MSKIDLTPAKLAELKQKAEAAKEVKWPTLDQFPQHEEYPAAEFIAAADPATVLALVEEIERLQEQNYQLRLKNYLEELCSKQESEAGQ